MAVWILGWSLGAVLSAAKALDAAARTPGDAMTRTVQVGSVVRDNDPRMHGRELSVSALTTASSRYPNPGSVLYTQHPAVELADGKRVRTVRLDRIHTDDKVRKSGWSLVR